MRQLHKFSTHLEVSSVASLSCGYRIDPYCVYIHMYKCIETTGSDPTETYGLARAHFPRAKWLSLRARPWWSFWHSCCASRFLIISKLKSSRNLRFPLQHSSTEHRAIKSSLETSSGRRSWNQLSTNQGTVRIFHFVAAHERGEVFQFTTCSALSRRTPFHITTHILTGGGKELDV